MRPVATLAGAAAFFCALPAGAARDVTVLDVVELDMGYTTIVDHYYRQVSAQVLLDGARTGIVAYLRGRGIADPRVPLLRARSDGRGVVPAIEQQLGKALDRYGVRVDASKLVQSVIAGELGALRDPYSVFFTKSELTGFTAALDGRSFGGIGVVLAGDSTRGYRADEVFDDGPAARAGLVAGDSIVAVDGRRVEEFDPDALTAVLRGRPGTTVRLDVLHAGDPAQHELLIARAAVTPPDVRSRSLPGAVGYLALRSFGPNASAQVRAALVRLRAQGAHAIVFDLRGNGGGYESSAVRVASAFVPSGAIVLTQTNHGHTVVTNADGSALAPLPLAVLADRDSASASELVIGAIADHGLGTVVGARTFGKGLVQTMFPLPDGSAMKVTTARYFTPNGADIDRVGITPDVAVEQPADAVRGVPGRDAQLDAALRFLAKSGYARRTTAG